MLMRGACRKMFENDQKQPNLLGVTLLWASMSVTESGLKVKEEKTNVVYFDQRLGAAHTG